MDVPSTTAASRTAGSTADTSAGSGSGHAVELITADTAPLTMAPLFEGGDPGAIAAAYAHVPELCLSALPFIGQSLSPAVLGGRWTEMAILRTSAQLGCRYCITAHTPVALDSELTHDEVSALRLEGDDVIFGDARDAAVLAYIDAVATGRGPIADAVEAAAARHLEDFQRVALVNTIGVTMLLNRFCTALGLPSSEESIERCRREGFGSVG